jgi:hypothetical protein
MVWIVLIGILFSIGCFYLGVIAGSNHVTKVIAAWMIRNNYHNVLREFNNHFSRR